MRIKSNENGNALLYVLIAIALFAGLNFALTRQTGTGDTSEIDDAKAEILATQLMTYSAQVKSVIDQMLITGSTIDDLDFTLPSNAAFNTPPNIHKVFHPEGGGLTLAKVPSEALHVIAGSPAPGWHLGQFNNVEWTKTSATDVLLTAYQIDKKVCEKINKNITGSETIPAFTTDMLYALVDSASNSDLDTAMCPTCNEYSTLCVSNLLKTAYSFYNVVADR